MEDARSLGLSQVMNVILIGALAANSKVLPFNQEHLKQAVKENVPQKYYTVNLEAFEKGFSYKIG